MATQTMLMFGFGALALQVAQADPKQHVCILCMRNRDMHWLSGAFDPRANRW